jgi:hypothetical protein
LTALNELIVRFVICYLLLLTLSCSTNRLAPETTPAALSSCINNLRQIDAAKQEWALQVKAPSNAIPTWDNILPYLGRGTAGALPSCPQGGNYTIGNLQSAPTCSIPGHTLD